MVKRSQSPGPANALETQSGKSKNRPQGPIPYYLRGKSVNEAMLPGGKQPGMAMGFVADYSTNDQAVKAQQSPRDVSMNVPGIPTVQAMIESGFKATFNLKDPKYGVKGYNI